MANILVATLGTWSLIPEVVGFTNPGLTELYRHHPLGERIRRIREENEIPQVDEVWVLTTGGGFSAEQLANLRIWYGLLPPATRPVLRIFRVAEIADMASEADCRVTAEAIMRVVLHARKRAVQGALVLSLAGGRKTMSSDLQRAASFFGCRALIHILQEEGAGVKMRNLTPEAFTRPLREHLVKTLMPVVTGRHGPHPALELGDLEGKRIRPEDYPVTLPDAGGTFDIRLPEEGRGARLLRTVERLERDARFLLCNYGARLRGEESPSAFMALYGLRPELIERLKATRIGIDRRKREEEIAFLRRLPKTELHCHLGGVAEPGEIVEIAEACAAKIRKYENYIEPWLEGWRKILAQKGVEGLRGITSLKGTQWGVRGVPVPFCTVAFALLFREEPESLGELIYGRFAEEGAFVSIGFEKYEAMGDLQGSGLLQCEETIRAACRVLVRKAREHNVKYLELRCSPINYRTGGLPAERVVDVLHEELGQAKGLECALLFTTSRHGDLSRVKQYVTLAENLTGPEGSAFPRLRGFDVAGHEKARKPDQMRDLLMPMMERCFHFTIHAGEVEDVESIWQAVYHLNAERIGHGLTLNQNPTLKERFLDRNIAIEMCPSSNFQIVGFRDNYLPKTGHLREYPLKSYLQAGLRVTVNTDNPGISRTDPTAELHRAARLTPGGLSLWDVLVLIRNGFKAAFSDPQTKHRLIRAAEEEILSLLEKDLLGLAQKEPAEG